MKIVFVINSLYGGGAERVLTLVANELAKRGYEVVIITYLSNSKYTLYNTIRHIAVFDNDEMKKVDFFSKFKRRLIFYFRIIKILKLQKPDILISFLNGMNRKIIPIAKFLKLKLIVSEHNNHKAGRNFFSWFARRWLYKLPNAVTVLTKYDYNNYYKHFLKNVVVMPNPVTFNSIDNISQREKVILVAGYLDRWEHKGFDNLLFIFAEIVKKHPQWKLKIAGSGDKGMQYLKDIAKRLDIENNVIFLGFVKNINEEFKKASIYVLSSRYEGFPMVLIEAMSQGCACISYNCISGPSEIIQDGIDGIIVEDQNMKEMEKAISKLINDESLRNSLAKNAITNIQKFSIDKIGDRWVNLIEDIYQRNA